MVRKTMNYSFLNHKSKYYLDQNYRFKEVRNLCLNFMKSRVDLEPDIGFVEEHFRKSLDYLKKLSVSRDGVSLTMSANLITSILY